MSAAFSFHIQKSAAWLFATRCGVLGSLFALFGAAGLIALLRKPAPDSLVLAAGCLAAAGVLLAVHTAALRRDRQLLKQGRKVAGKADGTGKSVLVHSGPVVYLRHFSVRFHYTVDGVTYQGRSRFSWIAPALPADGSLTVFVDPADPRRCAVDLWAV